MAGCHRANEDPSGDPEEAIMTTFTGTNGNDILPPPGEDNSGDDDFFALDGDDQIHAGAGNDEVDSSSGNDTAYGEAGDDFLNGGIGNDKLYGGADTDDMDGGGGNDTLDGGTGADDMRGNFGDDKYYVDNVGDLLTEFAASDGFDRVYSSVTFTLSQFLENLYLTGTAVIDGTGNDGANQIYGNDKVNTLTGLEGNDRLNGGIGADFMLGGVGSDTYYVDSSKDTVNELGGDGIDKVYSSVSYNLANTTWVKGDVETLVLTGAANITGSGNALDNMLTGNSGNNLLRAAAGNDTVSGAAGNDEMQGSTGDDALKGGAGVDLLNGGAGADRLTGGTEADTFFYRYASESTVATAGRDTIYDMLTGTDLIDLATIDANTTLAGNQAFSFIDTAAFSSTAGELRVGVSGTALLVEGDLNGNGTADFAILVRGSATLAETDFIL
jgi:Ca2+-binding RTX toxin-like protein